jgi:hypothetical protein
MTEKFSEYTIREPKWNGGRWEVGIADFRMKRDLKIRVSYKDKSGNEMFPNVYFMNRAKALQYPFIEKTGGYGKFKIHLIPIQDFDIIG